MMMPRDCKGQLSLEALLAFAILLSALSVLIFAAQGLGGRLDGIAGESAARYSASYAALCLDEAAQSMGASSFRVAQPEGLAVENNGILSADYPPANEKFFHNITYGAGAYVVQNRRIEPS